MDLKYFYFLIFHHRPAPGGYTFISRSFLSYSVPFFRVMVLCFCKGCRCNYLSEILKYSLMNAVYFSVPISLHVRTLLRYWATLIPFIMKRNGIRLF